jgi:hypothetical protein
MKYQSVYRRISLCRINLHSHIKLMKYTKKLNLQERKIFHDKYIDIHLTISKTHMP